MHRGRSVEEHAAAVSAAVDLAVSRRALDPPDLVRVEDLRGGRLAAAVTSRRDVPAFDNSQMDGFAVRTADLVRVPVTLPTVAHVVAGGDSPAPLAPGTVAPIMTGAPIPPGADAVVPVERTHPDDFGPVEGGGSIEFSDPVEPGTFVRRRGEDLSVGDEVFPAGSPVTPAVISALLATGVVDIEVAAPLRLAVIGTGTEVARGLVPDSNSAALLAHARELGLPVTTHTVEDDPAAFTAVLTDAAARHDLIVTTGGVSAGTREVVRQVLEPTAGSWFDHVEVQPGGPQGLAVWKGVPVVCLPGNPVSVLVSFELFLRPALAAAAGVVAERPAGSAPLAAPLTSPAGRVQVRRGRFDDDGRIVLVGGPGSHLVVSYARSPLLVFVPAEVTALAAGDTVPWWRIG